MLFVLIKFCLIKRLFILLFCLIIVLLKGCKMFRRNFHFRVSPTDHKPRGHPFSTNAKFRQFFSDAFPAHYFKLVNLAA